MKIKSTQFAALCLMLCLLLSGVISAQSGCPNLIANGNFQAGNTGFTSGLSLGCNSCTANTYCVTNNFTGKCSGWPSVFDHTFGNSTGLFMAIDGSTMGANDVWSLTGVPVTPGITYEFSFWVATVFGPGQQVFDLEMRINNTTVSIGNVSQTVGVWTRFFTTWVCPSGVFSVPLAIRQMTPGAFRDFGIDDIGFSCVSCQADFIAEELGPCGAVQFINQSIGQQPPSSQWNFGDPNSGANNISFQNNPTHQFSTCGTFNVCLTFTASNGCVDIICKPVTITDNIPPVALCQPGQGYSLNAGCTLPVTVGMIDAGSFDNCLIQSMSVSPAVVPGCGVFPITLTVTDWCGNTSICSTDIQTIEVVPPVIMCPPNVQRNCNTNLTPAFTGFATATDNCMPAPTVTWSDVIVGQMPCDGAIIRTWTATDACGNESTCVQTITVIDNVPPVIVCPPTFSAECNGNFPPSLSGTATATDNCTATSAIVITFTDVLFTIFNPITFQTCDDYIRRTWKATDQCGNMATCIQIISVHDDVKPVLTNCPQNITVTGTLNPQGLCTANVQVTSPTVTDNCDPTVTLTNSFNGTASASGVYPSGTTTVIWTATDNCGNVETCSFVVNVVCTPCQCGTFSNMSIRWGGALNVPVSCGGAYPIPALHIVLTGDFICQGNNCPMTTIDWKLTDPTGTVVLSNVNEPATPNFSIALTPSPFLSQGCYELTLKGQCGADSCFCKIKFCPTISPEVRDTAVCRTSTTAYIPLINCPTACGVTQVRWFVKPCSASVWPTTPYQISSGPGCADLLFLPYQYTGEACVEVYSEITLDGRCCGTTLLTSNTATVTLCDPVSCTINNPNPAFCQSGNPAALQVSFPSAPPCDYTVQWYYQGAAINGATNLSYQPPVLNFPTNLPSSVCFYDHGFSVVLTGPCGPSTCATTIRVYNDNADAGQIDMIPFESQPFCPGEDATLVYSPACAELPSGPPPMWTWWSSVSSGSGFNQIPGSGTMDGVINTNKLWQTTWYKVIKQNGVCPADEIDYQIVVKDALVINNFTAVPDPCADTQVALTVDFTPSPIAGTDTDTGVPCLYVIDWYLNGNLIHTSTSMFSSVTWTYPSPTPGSGSIAGVYYAVVRDNCCPQSAQTWPIIIDPTCVPIIIGPCFRCFNDNSPITLTGVMVLPPKDPCPDFCTYQWYDGTTGTPIPGATNATYISPTAGIFIFESNCNGCIRTAVHEVVQCGMCIVSVDDFGLGVHVKIYPNPTTGDMTVQISPMPLRNGTVKVVDLNGKVLVSEKIPDGQEKHTLSLAHLPTGLYFVQVFENDVLVWIDKIVRDQ